jgi:hypothetical protein
MTAIREFKNEPSGLTALTATALGSLEDQRKAAAMSFGSILTRNCAAFTQNLEDVDLRGAVVGNEWRGGS